MALCCCFARGKGKSYCSVGCFRCQRIFYATSLCCGFSIQRKGNLYYGLSDEKHLWPQGMEIYSKEFGKIDATILLCRDGICVLIVWLEFLWNLRKKKSGKKCGRQSFVGRVSLLYSPNKVKSGGSLWRILLFSFWQPSFRMIAVGFV